MGRASSSTPSSSPTTSSRAPKRLAASHSESSRRSALLQLLSLKVPSPCSSLVSSDVSDFHSPLNVTRHSSSKADMLQSEQASESGRWRHERMRSRHPLRDGTNGLGSNCFRFCERGG